MTDQSNPSNSQHERRSRTSVVLIASLFLFCLVFVALWAFTTLGFVYAIATASPVTLVVACSIAMLDGVADVFAAVVEAIMAVFAAIAEAIGAVIAAVLAALAAVFSIFGG